MVILIENGQSRQSSNLVVSILSDANPFGKSINPIILLQL